MEVLYLTYDGLTDPLGRSQILPYIVGLARMGVRFTVVSFEKGKYRDNVPEVESVCDQNNVRWARLDYH